MARFKRRRSRRRYSKRKGKSISKIFARRGGYRL